VEEILHHLLDPGQAAASHRIGGEDEAEEGDGEDDRHQGDAEQDRPAQRCLAAAGHTLLWRPGGNVDHRRVVPRERAISRQQSAVSLKSSVGRELG
jgi:hypothetical protein